jgi:hypothetical protein
LKTVFVGGFAARGGRVLAKVADKVDTTLVADETARDG